MDKRAILRMMEAVSYRPFHGDLDLFTAEEVPMDPDLVLPQPRRTGRLKLTPAQLAQKRAKRKAQKQARRKQRGK